MKNNKHTWRYEVRSCAMPQPLKRTPMFTYKPSNELLDEVNIRVLEELQRDPRLTMTELGRRVGMSSPAVTERVRRMEEAGGITGYRITIDPVAVGVSISAYFALWAD